jgi:CheY-like chemotaxis protein
MKVLIVDDEPDLCDIISLFLEMKGHQAVIANCGISGLNTLETEEVDLILSDIRMPKCGGIEFLERLKDKIIPHPPFLFMTGFSEVTEEEVVARGAKALLKKPVSFDDLLKALEEHGEGSS